MTIEFVVPVRTFSLMNSRDHWGEKANAAKRQRDATALMWIVAGRPMVRLPAEVTLTRIAPKSLDDDNLRGAGKHVRDEIAKCIGVDDRDPRVTWRYAQAKGAPHEYAMKVEIRARSEREDAA